jgi:very-short-patch-repair endonuclease
MYTPEQKEAFRLHLFNNPSPPEQIMLKVMEGRYNFEFQPILKGYIPDFYFPDYNVILEVDGKSYHKNKKKDAFRDKVFLSVGIRTLRVSARSVFNNVGKVLEKLDKFIKAGK